MPLKLNVGLSRKVGEANYGSRGASVNLELELDTSLVSEPHRLQDKIRELFRLAKASVDEELNGGPDGHRDTEQANEAASRRPNGRPATQSQVRAIRAIAGGQRLDLAAELRERFNLERPEDLSLTEASQLIDELKAPRAANGGRR